MKFKTVDKTVRMASSDTMLCGNLPDKLEKMGIKERIQSKSTKRKMIALGLKGDLRRFSNLCQ